MCNQYVIVNDKGQYQYLKFAPILEDLLGDIVPNMFIAIWSSNLEDAELYSSYGEAEEATREYGGKVINVCDINA